MPSARPLPARPPLPRLPLALLGLLLPRPERDEVLADLRTEYGEHAAADGPAAARRWLWVQALRSAPALLRWSWWRGWTGFEPRANAYRPGGAMLKTWITDARYAARRLRTRPSYTLLSVLTLALGVGGTAAVYGLARGMLFDPLPYGNEREIGQFWFPYSWSEQEFLYLRGRIPGFAKVASYTTEDRTLREGDAPAKLIPGLAASAELFDVLGTQPMIGRGFREGDDVPGAEPVVVLSWGLWQELGGRRDIVGSRLVLDGTPRTVIGVMPRGFWFPSPAIRVWAPIALSPENRSGNYSFVGRVAPGHDVANMAAPMQQFVKILDERFDYPPQWDKTKDPKITPIREDLMGEMKPALVATLVAMGLILLIACANVAALMLGQVEGRAGELAVRSALGANRSRLVQQLVVEALLVGVAAAVAGAAVAAGSFHLLARALPLGAWGESASLDWGVFAAAGVLAIGAALLVVLVPTTALWRGDLRDTLSASRTGGIKGRGGNVERALVVSQVALAMLIASGAALLARSVSNLYAIDPGIETDGVAVLDVVTSGSQGISERQRTIRELLATLAQLPGVQYAAASHKLPLRGNGSSTGMAVEGVESEERTTTFFRFVSHDYFQTLGLPVKRGRTFQQSDVYVDSTSERVVVVNEALVKKYFGGQDPVGRRVATGFGGWARVVGVVGNAAEGDLTDDAEPARYLLYDQYRWTPEGQSLVVRTRGDAAAILDDARQAIQRTAPNVAVMEATTMERLFDIAVGPARQVMTLLALLSGLALVLGAVGIYGVISHFAARRKRDWAIRVALGLPGSRVVRHIVGQGALLVVMGVAIGAVGTVALARLLTSFLFGVSTVDPIAFASAFAALLAIGVVAALVPARRAGSVNPARVLREQ